MKHTTPITYHGRLHPFWQKRELLPLLAAHNSPQFGSFWRFYELCSFVCLVPLFLDSSTSCPCAGDLLELQPVWLHLQRFVGLLQNLFLASRCHPLVVTSLSIRWFSVWIWASPLFNGSIFLAAVEGEAFYLMSSLFEPRSGRWSVLDGPPRWILRRALRWWKISRIFLHPYGWALHYWGAWLLAFCQVFVWYGFPFYCTDREIPIDDGGH